MAQNDWTDLNGVLNGAQVAFGASRGYLTPNGGGQGSGFWRSLTAATGIVGKFHNGANFVPTLRGAMIASAIRRGPSAGGSGYAPFLFVCLGGTNVTDQGYILGLANASPSHAVLRKGALAGGLPDVAPGTQGVLWRSTEVFTDATWQDLALHAATNTNGDVVLSVWRNDLALHTVASPTFVALPGVNLLGQNGNGITDDPAGFNTGSFPFTSGRVGWGGYFADVSRSIFFDHIRGIAQP